MSAPEVDELVQEVRIRLWQSLADGAHDEIPASYFKKVVLSAAIDLERRRRRLKAGPAEQGEGENSEDAVTSLADSTYSSPDRQLEEKELAMQVAKAVAALAPPRDVVVRLYLAGYNHVEIAQFMMWTAAKARNLLYRGLADLRARLREEGIDPALTP